MSQPTLPGFGELSLDNVVNVASVKHRSPFRYPGGKTWLVPRIRQWLSSRSKLPTTFIEPFAGGAIVGLTVAFERLAERVILVELDEQVAAVWDALVTKGEGKWLADQIIEFECTSENVDALLSRDGLTTRELAFQTIVRNRVNHGGIMAPGSGKLKHGENGRGVTSRWYPATLSKRILDIDSIRDRLSFIHGDAFEIISQHATNKDAAFFIDPPYTASGKKPGNRLYTHWQIDHEKLFGLMSEVTGDFLMTYDKDTEVIELANRHGLKVQAIAMKNTHHAKLSELLIAKDLSWLKL